VAQERADLNVEIVQDARATLGECPIWDQRTERLHWVDIRAGLVHRFSPSDGSDLVFDVGQSVGSVGLGADGGLVVGLRDGFGLIPSNSERVAAMIEVEKQLTGNRMNDGRCDAAGRFWAGTIASAWEQEPGAGALYRLEQSSGAFAATQVLADLTVANGMDWSPDQRRMYFIDSPTRRVDVFDFDLDSGTIRNRRPFVEIPVGEGMPDGLVVDAEGCVWVALIGGGRLRRFSPRARVDMEIELPVTLVTSATFGGGDLAQLYITTAKHRLTDAELVQQTHAGSVFCCTPGPTGSAPHYFSGV
jgi:sugar lactone lactonase YvrE